MFKRAAPTIGNPRTLLCLMMLLGVVLIVSAAPSSLAAPPARSSSEAFERVPCATFQLEHRDVECGYVSVPEFHSNPSGRHIKLAVVIIPRSDAGRSREAFAMAQGGPGGSTIDTFADFVLLGYYPALDDLRSERDIVLFDQRGTLYSQPALTCPEELEQTLKTLGLGLARAEQLKLDVEAALKCRERLKQQGINFDAYNSIENAKDIEAIRRALGYDRFDFYGVSYGTLLGLHGLDQTPTTFRSMILDAVVPPHLNPNAAIAVSMHRGFERLFAECAADSSCNAAYPNLRQVFYDQVDLLNETPARVRLEDPETGSSYIAIVDGDMFMDVLFQFAYNSELLPALPKMIYDARDGRFTLVERYYPLVLFDRTFASGMYYAVTCSEDADFTLKDMELETVDPHIAALQELDSTALLDLCSKWNVAQLGAAVDAPVSSDVPTLLFSGELDPITPPEFAEGAAARLKNHYHYTFPAYGHGAVTSGDCPNRIMLEFVRNPQRPPNAECIKATDGIAFVTPGSLVDAPGIGQMNYAILRGNLKPFIVPAALLAVLLSIWYVWPLAWLIRRARAERGLGESKRASNPWHVLAPLLAMLTGGAAAVFWGLLAIVVLFVALSGGNTILLLFGLPRAAFPLVAILWLYLFLTLGLCSVCVLAWMRSFWGMGRRLYFTIVVTAAVGLAIWFIVNGAVVTV